MFKVNHTKIKYLFTKVIIYLLITIILSNIIIVPAQAAMTITKNNSQEYNQEILDTLTRLLGSEAEAKEVLETMYKLGLLDGDGELVTASINVDGVEMTLDQIRELLSEGVDLNKIVTVDGTPITLGNLKIMLQIEDEIQRIKDTYFNEDITLNDAQKMALASLREQIETTGIRMFTAGPSEIQFPSGINHDIYIELDTDELVCDNGSGGKSVDAVLKDKDGNPLSQAPDYDISISYRFVDGSAKKGTNYSGSNGTLAFEANGPASKTVSFSILNDTSRFEGQKIFLLQYYNPQNIKLKDGIRAAQKLITINNSFTWPALSNLDIPVETSSYTKLRDTGKNVNWQKKFVIPDDLVRIMIEEDIYSTFQISFKNTGSSLSNAMLHLVLGNDMEYYLYYSDPSHLPSEIPLYSAYTFDMGTLSKNRTFTSTVFQDVNLLKWEAPYMWRAQDPYTFEYYSGGCLYIEMPDASRDIDTGSEGVTGIYNVKITDQKRPIPIATAQGGAIFEYGQTVPINVDFEEPVNLTGVSMTVNGQTLYPEEVNTKSRYATFLYEIGKWDYTFLDITSITGAKDLIGNDQYEFDKVKLEDIIKDTIKYRSFTNPSVSTTTDGGDMTGEVSIDLSTDDELILWLENEAVLNYDEKLNKWKVPSLYASVDGGNTKIDLYVDSADKPTKLIGAFDVAPNPYETNVTRAVEFYLDPVVGSSSNHSPWIGPYATYTVPPAVFLEEGDFYITDNFPADNIVFAEDNTVSRLEYTVTNPNASWKRKSDFIWSSNNPAVATIDQEGIIYPMGLSGTVTFTLTALNGNVEGKAITATSKELIVKVGLKPFLNIPTGTNTISIKSGDSAQVRWISNLIAKNDEYSRDAEFNIKVFTADYSSGELQKGDSVYSTTLRGNTSNQISSFTIPAQYLTGVSVIGKYSYIVEVSSDNPYKEGEVLKATAYIYISSRPVISRFQKLNSYFITDSTSQLPINWTLDYYDAINEAEFEFSITNNANNEIIHQQKTTAITGGNYTLNIPKVENGFKDVYTVTVKAKNSLDLTWSYDSFVLYVYSDDALKIWVNGKATDGTYTMSNIPQIKNMTSEEILAMKRDIYLKDVISINYGDHAWGQISDQIKWQSSDNSIAKINYKQGTIYDNIENYTYTSYRPTTEFLLTGLKNGTARIKATHASTNSTKIVDVRVETLKDKLYLFQMYPKAKTTLVYVNGNGETCTVDTNSNGELALYEESGINSEIYMKSTSGGKEYMGTLYEGLVSSEKDYTKLELYPVNTFYLTEIATVELYFKKPDGTPFSGSAILRGGVYKNGGYCGEAKLNEKNGDEDQIITIGADGKFTVKMDESQFWVDSFDEGLRYSDKLELICELRYPDDTYYPNLLCIDLSYNPKEKVRVGDINFKVDRVSEEDKNKPFIAIQKVDFGFASGRLIDVRGFKGKIGPGQTSEKLTLSTTTLWWGENDFSKKDNHNLTFKDQYGFIPKNQSNETIVYPFSTIMGTRNTFVLDRSTLKGWMDPKISRGMNLIMTDAKGDVYDKKMPFRIINMYDIDKVQEDDSLFFLLETMSTGFGADAGSMGLDDAVVGDGLRFLSTIGIGNTSNSKLFNMVVSPTVDPTVFMAFIGVNAGNMSNDNVTGVYYENNLDSDFDYTPSLFDVLDMQKGKYLDNQKKNNNKNPANGLSKGNRNISFTLGGYMEAEISFNYENGEWEIFILNGGFNAGGGVSYDWNYNTFVGPVPVTGQFTVGATAEVIFKAAVLGGEQIKLQYNEDTVNNYLTTLRIYAYIRAFAGLGFDYSVAALKIGLFGQISVDAQFAFLNQPHISSTAVTGRRLDVRGRAGVEFVAKFLFVSYEKILASIEFDLYGKSYGKWNDIQKTWEDIKKGSSGKPGILSYYAIPMPDGSVMYPVSEEAIIEDRDYLEAFERSWAAPSRFGLFSLDPENGVKDLETNSYPYSNPVLSSDGKLLLYVSDANSTNVEDTEIRYSKMTSGSYPNGTPVEAESESFGDSQLKLSGDEDFAAAVWVMQNQSIIKEAGESITNNDLALMSNSTEIMAAIYNGTSWNTRRLTDNAIPDMAPAVATNGDKVLVAWRNVYASDSSNPLNFDGKDSILYTIYDGTAWTEPQTLYNGTSGSVKGLEAAMLKDGTAAVTYTIDTEGFEADAPQKSQGVLSSLETVYAIVDTNGDVVKNVRMTNDTYLDENPQIEAVMFDDEVERFVLGWYSLQDADGVSTNDIRLCAFDKNGALYNNFIDSISSVNSNTVVNISRNFRFAKNAQSIDDLSILWTESENAGIDDDGKVLADKDSLKAVKFVNDNGRIYITSVLDVATMDDFTLIDHFDAYISGENEIKAVILGTDYGTGYKETTIKVVEDGVVVDKIISTPISVSGLYTATGKYENKVEITSVAVDHKSVIRGTQIPVQFTVFNAGIEPINALTIKVGDNETTFNTDFLMLPNESKILTVYYDVPEDTVINPEYTVTATFGEVSGFGFGKGMKVVASTDTKMAVMTGFGVLSETDTKSGTLYLNIPDVGVSKLECVSEDKGKRVMQVTLYNDSDIMLAGSNRKVKIGFYEDLDCTLLTDEVSGQDSEANTVFEVNSADLWMIDAGAYTKQFTFYIKEFVGEDEEIPDTGIRLYAKAWIEEPFGEETDTILEYNQNNNYSSLLFESPIKLNDGKPVTISTEKTDIGGITKVTVTVKNNSLINVTSGNLIINLLDEDGKVIESLQSYDRLAANSGLITLMGEETAQRTFTFSKKGNSLAVSYSNAILDKDNNTNLADLTLGGIAFLFEKGKVDYSVIVSDLKETLVTASTEDPNATININGEEGTFGTAMIKLNYGINVIRVVVVAADGITTQAYTIRINNLDPSKPAGNNSDSDNRSENAVVLSPIVAAQNGMAAVTISDEDIARLLYRVDGTGRIVISPIITGNADKIIFDIPASAISAVVNTGTSLSLETQLFNVFISPDSLADIIAGGANQISISIEQNNGLYSLRINRDGIVLSNIYGGVTAYVNATGAGSGLVAALIYNGESAFMPVTFAGNIDGAPVQAPDKEEIFKLSVVKDGKMIVPLKGSAIFKLVDKSKSFIDTKGYGSHIDFVSARELFFGTSPNTFSPDLSMNRSMVVAVLGRLGDIDVSGYKSSKFTDVINSAYYAPYIEWAAQNGIVHGVGQNRFLPEQAITREQLATILFNYINFADLKLDYINNDNSSFADDNEISDYARNAIMTMKKAGIIYGKANNRFDPKGTATRAEVAAMLERLVKNIIK